ncbi:MAG: AAA family ATPase [Alphaproteobacteria bacterium]
MSDPPPTPDSVATSQPAVEVLSRVEPSPSPDTSPDTRADEGVTLRREDLTITRRGQGPSAAELLARGYSFATGADGRMVIYDADGNLADTATMLPSADSAAASAPAAAEVNEAVPAASGDSMAASEATPPASGDGIAADSVEAETVAADAAAESEVASAPVAEVMSEAAPPASAVEAETVAADAAAESEATSAPVAEALAEMTPVGPEPTPDVTPDVTPLPKVRKRARREPVAETVDERTPPLVPRVLERTGGEPGRMYVIAVSSQKGGSGKTTIAAHLAVRADAAGQGPVVLIDTDPQGSLAEWWQARADDSPALATVRPEELAANLAELRSYGTAIAIIDTPPALTGSIEQVIAMADLILIPVRPSPHDLRAAGGTVELARKAGKPFMFIVNSASPRASITAQAVAALSEHGRVAPVILYQRTEYAASMIDGRTVTETAGSGRSAQEIIELWQCVYAQIGMRVAA